LPYDLTTSYQPGARRGPIAILEASTHLETYDDELEVETFERVPIATLAAVVPDGSKSLMDEVDHDATALFHAEWIGTDPTVDPAAARRFLFHDCAPETADWALATLRRFVPMSVYSARVAPAPSIPAVSIVPEDDRTLRADWMIAASKERLGVEAIVVPGGHCPHVSRPADLAVALASLGGRRS
ncbi:MAG: arginase family protein, partial [Actinobacteria bacterium]|nr:arginase family protein [Actinomycetota bacterium]